jgi:hypothetical protein
MKEEMLQQKPLAVGRSQGLNELLCTNELGNLEEIEKFLEAHNLPRWSQEGIKSPTEQ